MIIELFKTTNTKKQMGHWSRAHLIFVFQFSIFLFNMRLKKDYTLYSAEMEMESCSWTPDIQ